MKRHCEETISCVTFNNKENAGITLKSNYEENKPDQEKRREIDSITECLPEQDLMWACVHGDFLRFREAISNGGDHIVESEDRKHGLRPIHFACAFGNVELVTLLVAQYNANIKFAYSETVKPPVWYAAEQGHSRIVQFLVEHHNALDDDCLPQTWEDWDKALPEILVDQQPQRPLPSHPDPWAKTFALPWAKTAEYSDAHRPDTEVLLKFGGSFKKSRLDMRQYLQNHFENTSRRAIQASAAGDLEASDARNSANFERLNSREQTNDESNGRAKTGFVRGLSQKLQKSFSKFGDLRKSMSKVGDMLRGSTGLFKRSASSGSCKQSGSSVIENSEEKPGLLRKVSSMLLEKKEAIKKKSIRRKSIKKKPDAKRTSKGGKTNSNVEAKPLEVDARAQKIKEDEARESELCEEIENGLEGLKDLLDDDEPQDSRGELFQMNTSDLLAMSWAATAEDSGSEEVAEEEQEGKPDVAYWQGKTSSKEKQEKVDRTKWNSSKRRKSSPKSEAAKFKLNIHPVNRRLNKLAAG